MDYPGKVITKTQVTPTQTSASGNWTLDDQAAAIKNNNWPVALVPNPISKSLRFNSADSANLTRTFGSAPTNDDKATISLWVKRTNPGAENQLYSARASGAAAYTSLRFDSTDELDFLMVNSSGTVIARLVTTAKYRDPSAWYHIVFAYDSTDATSSNRLKLYVNGVQVTVFNTATYPAQNTDLALWAKNTVVNYIGREGDGYSSYLNGYLTEINFIDGQALDPSNFGLTNPQTGQWIPLKYSGTYGTNGFYLNFKDATSTTTLGYDYSGNANNWTTNNFSVTAGAGNDSLTDVPTPWIAYNTTGDVGGVIRGNYCTWNPFLRYSALTAPANGNLDISGNNANWRSILGTIAATSGKWYAEFTVQAAGADMQVGVFDLNNSAEVYQICNTDNRNLTRTASGYAYQNNAKKVNNNTETNYGATYTTNDVIGIALDLDGGTITFYKNGSSQGQAYSSLSGNFTFGVSTTSSNVFNANFGQRPFAYTPPAGFRSLCTTNLPATAIGFGLTNQAGKYFNPVLYTGNGSSQSITGVGFQPDFTWIKSRSGADNHNLFNAVVGLPNRLFSNLGNAENTTAGTVTAFNSDGFSVGSISDVNANGVTFVGWNWNAGGSTVTNTSGTISAQVRANTTAGFSIISYTGNKTSGATIGHGLGVAPAMVIIKERANSSDWIIYHQSLGATQSIYFTTAASNTNSIWFNNTAPSSTVITLGNSDGTNRANTMIAYAFAPVAGYSAFGSYTGNGSADGPFVYLGFRPEFVMIKNASATGDWFIYDAVRNTYNVSDNRLKPNLSDAEGTGGSFGPDILSNGFKMRSNFGEMNGSGNTIIYACFAESPFQFANAR
jgi:hypothetical protein